MHDKLQNADVLAWILQHDIVFFSELRSDAPISVPGFHTYQDSRHGGIAALVRNCLVSSLVKVDLSTINQCWIELQCLPGITIVGCYIPPPDSPYFSLNDVAALQCRIIASEKKCFLIGDFNARCGETVKTLPSLVPHAWN